jgi:hypothetical protein
MVHYYLVINIDNLVVGAKISPHGLMEITKYKVTHSRKARPKPWKSRQPIGINSLKTYEKTPQEVRTSVVQVYVLPIYLSANMVYYFSKLPNLLKKIQFTCMMCILKGI